MGAYLKGVVQDSWSCVPICLFSFDHLVCFMIVCLFYVCVLLEDFFCMACMADNYYAYVVETLKVLNSIALTGVLNSRQ